MVRFLFAEWHDQMSGMCWWMRHGRFLEVNGNGNAEACKQRIDARAADTKESIRTNVCKSG